MTIERLLILNEKLDAFETPPPGKIYVFLDGTTIKYKTSAGTIFTLATGVTPEDVQQIVAQFLQAGSTKVSLNHNDPLNIFTIDVNENQLNHANFQNVGTNSHGDIDNHIASNANPHGTTAAQVGADPSGSAAAVQTNLNTHTGNFLNPHGTTKAQVGLPFADNTADIDKPISLATQNALDLKYPTSNPNGYETPGQLNTRDTANRSRANHTGSQLASTISDLSSAVLSVILAGLVFTANTAVLATDSILVAIGKLQAQLNDIFAVLAAQVIGDNFQDFNDNTVFTTTSNVNQIAASFATTAKAVGRYRIGITWDWFISSNTSDSIFSVWLDGVQVSGEFRLEHSETVTQRLNNSWFFYTNFASITTHTLELRARAETNGVTVTVSNVNAEIWRASV